jgi:hypothetical protein
MSRQAIAGKGSPPDPRPALPRRPSGKRLDFVNVSSMNYYTIQLPRITDGIAPDDELGDELALDGICSCPNDLLAVTTRSPKPHRRAVWQLATYFRREFQYDCVQYGHLGNENDATARAYLWLGPDSGGGDSKCYTIGACCFRWREWENMPPMWAMQWVWFHPYGRRQGKLRNAWSYFRARFELFDVEPPYSQAMKAFLDYAGWKRPEYPKAIVQVSA